MDNKWKSLLSYLIYTIVLLLIIFLGLKYQAVLYSYSKDSYEILPYLQFKAIFPLVLGVYLAIPHLIKASLKAGKWDINWIKLIVLGLPFLYASVIPVLYLTEMISVDFLFLSYIMGGYFGNGASITFETINGILAGYVVFTSIDKKNNIQEEK
ncbi:hypothetical protein FS935_01225 [Metabacillus litoralis]|uniref:Uncharacterized protein n=1 Tax=Metabacillus litoralis TaxID=152268 RepID=A0A5C6WAD4_9BACI|nr:hypothetical protein [Metabacillus litoralis]TXC92849.1 hypothetical protein FS935_01225 [Metabacillus litoralis]